MDVFTFIVSTVAFIGLVLVFLDLLWKPKLNLPYPKRIPLVGHLLSFIKAPHLMTTAWAEQHGNIYCLQLLHKTVVIVTGYEEAHEVLVAKGNDFAGCSPTFRTQLVSQGGMGIIYKSMNTTWKTLRMWTHRIIKQYGEGLGRIENIVQEIAKKLVMDIERDMDDDGSLDPYENIYNTVANVMAALITGTHLAYDDPVFQTLLQMDILLMPNLSLGTAELDACPWFRHFGNQTYKSLCKFNAYKAKFFKILQDMYRNNCLSQDSLAFALFKEMEGESDFGRLLTDEDVTVLLVDVSLAGVTTSGATFYIFLQLMATHPDTQEKIFEEIKACKGFDIDEPMKLSDCDKMPYTRACLLEVLRYASVAVSTINHTAMVDTDILGHKVPKGTEVYVNIFGLHHNEEYWEEPWNFKPERFLDDHGQLVLSDHINRKRLMPFGAGTRVCIGKSLATSRLFLLITSVLKEFEISQVPGVEIHHDPRQYAVSAILNAPRTKIAFSRRKAAC